MTTITHPDCRCGHHHATHFTDGFAPQCVAAHCTCTRYRPTDKPAAAMRPATVTPTPAPDHGQLLAFGRASTVATTRKLTEKITGLLHDLRGRVETERNRGRLLTEIEQLEAQLTQLRAQLRNGKPRTPAAEQHNCADCDRTFTAAHGLAVHRARKHRTT